MTQPTNPQAGQSTLADRPKNQPAASANWRLLAAEDLTPEFVSSVFEERDGVLYRRFRDDEFFGRPRDRVSYNRHQAGKMAGFQTKNGYVGVRLGGHIMLVHRIVWAIRTGQWPSGHLDHINRNRSDNRFENLRGVTCSLNAHNRGIGVNSKTGTNGVSWAKRDSVWLARLWLNGAMVHYSRHSKIEDAIVARLAAEQSFGLSEFKAGAK